MAAFCNVALRGFLPRPRTHLASCVNARRVAVSPRRGARFMWFLAEILALLWAMAVIGFFLLIAVGFLLAR